MGSLPPRGGGGGSSATKTRPSRRKPEFEKLQNKTELKAEYGHDLDKPDELRPKIKSIEFTPEQDALVNTLWNGSDLKEMSEEKRMQHIYAMYRVAAKMPKEAATRARGNISYTRILETPQQVTAECSKRSGRLAQKGEMTVGFYSVRKRDLWVDGLTSYGGLDISKRGVWSHEIGHAIDGPDCELSHSAEWNECFQAELTSGELSKYATTHAEEGFAEFCRAIYGSDVPQEKVEAMFPRCTAFFRKRGLI